jgi:hypothetical protein
VFPSARTHTRPLTDHAIISALRRTDYTSEQMSVARFRAMAATLLTEQAHPPEVIELQLARQERNELQAACNRAQRMDERRRMMQAWSNYLDVRAPAQLSSRSMRCGSVIAHASLGRAP